MFSIQELLEATQGKLIQGPMGTVIKSVSIDSRTVTQGQLFIAIKGDIFDGHDFLKDVAAKGVKVLIVHKPIVIENEKVSVILVKDTTRALGYLAKYHRLRFKAKVIALTGSAGKTTTKEMIACVLGKKYRVLKNEGTQNNHIGVPLTLLKLNSSHQMVVLECGSNQPGDIPWLAEIVHPDIVVFTNIGESHLEKLKTPAGVLKEKWSLTSRLRPKGVVMINKDDVFLSAKTKGLRLPKIVTYGINTTCQNKADKITVNQGHTLSFEVSGKRVELNTCGTNNVYNALAAYACGRLMSVPAKDIASALKHFEFPKGRGQILKLGQGWLINDSYNANPVSMRCAIETLRAIPTQGKRIIIVADMLELGNKTKDLHSQVGSLIAQNNIEVLITVGSLARHMAAQARKRNKEMDVYSCADIESAQKHLAKVLQNGDAVLVKGSRRMAMERIVDFLLASPGVEPRP